MPMIKFSADIKPVTFKRPGSNRKHRYDPKEYANFKQELSWYAKLAMQGRAPLTGEIRIQIDICCKCKTTSRNFGDLDNHVKAVLDALNGICFEDDSQVVIITAAKFRGAPHINIELEECT